MDEQPAIQLTSEQERERAHALFMLIMDFLKAHKGAFQSFQSVRIDIAVPWDDGSLGLEGEDYHAIALKVTTTPFGNEITGRGKLKESR